MKRKNQRGIALIMVVCTVLVLTLMAEHLQVTTILLRDETLVTCARQYLRYAGESAAERGFWCYLCHTTAVPNPTSDPGATANLQQLPHGSYGLDHPFNYSSDKHAEGLYASAAGQSPDAPLPLRAGATPTDASFSYAVTFVDISSGSTWDFSRAAAMEQLRARLKRRAQANLEQQKVSNDEQAQAIDGIFDLLIDYIDPDETSLLHGREKYDDPVLPRNGPLQYREEIYWLDLPRDLLDYEDLRDLAKPENMAFIPPTRRQPPSLKFFSATEQDLLNVSDSNPPLTHDEARAILAARASYLRHLDNPPPWQPVDSFMEGTRFSTIRSRLDLSVRSQVLRVTVEAKDPAQGISRTLQWVRENPLLVRSGNLAGQKLVYWYRLL